MFKPLFIVVLFALAMAESEKKAKEDPKTQVEPVVGANPHDQPLYNYPYHFGQYDYNRGYFGHPYQPYNYNHFGYPGYQDYNQHYYQPHSYGAYNQYRYNPYHQQNYYNPYSRFIY